RAFRQVGGEPIFIKSACGSKIYSEDGREFIDYCQSFGTLILGHALPKVMQKLKEAVDKGASFGAATKTETELARIIIKAIPAIERIRFTNSGTEAVMGAIRVARAYTRKNKIIKFAGAYHGHADYLLDCAGIPQDFRKHTLVAPYNDIKKVKALIEQHKKDVAAIIVEPVAGNMGVVLPKKGFLEALRELSDKYQTILIFDEVITGFRLFFGGAQGFFKIKPDLTCLGKIIGGGLPVGAFGGRYEVMKLLAPEGNVYQAGTFSGNPLTVNTGLATLKILSEENPYQRLKKTTEQFCEKIKHTAGKYGIRVKVNFAGSIFSIFFTDTDVIDYNTSKAQDADLFKKFYHRLLQEGVYFSPSGFEANFISTAHTVSDIQRTLDAIDKTLKNFPA
ncbi:MAG: glutamate-1-semialdehyde 2,1-aminomutase, partial [Candidatus Omnitrophota bacterium]|nr:glutamate-1-semialdehyde 2,1-aminomutase [Candidatus Omnitrophota bacterium]